MTDRPLILIAEDDKDIASALSRGLGSDGYECVLAADAAEAQTARDTMNPAAAIIDVMLGADDGVELVRQMRAAGFNGPILMLSALSAVKDRTAGLMAGADDYIAKPFEYAELLARLRVQEGRRAQNSDSAPTPLIGRLIYNEELRDVSNGDRRVTLTEREAALLKLLAANGGSLMSRGQIFDTLWLNDGSSSENVVDVYIGYLRRKLAPMDDFGIALKTVRARGFLLTET